MYAALCSTLTKLRLCSVLTVAFAWMVLGLAGCSGGLPNPNASSSATQLTVSPPSITVAAGSTTTFGGVFTPAIPTGGSLTWAVTPVNAGTITNNGVYTASSTAGTYSVIATWTPAVATATAVIIKGTGVVTVLAVPQLHSVIMPDLVQASGGNQSNGAIQNSVIVGQPFPSVTSSDSSGNVQVRSGFTPPTACTGSSSSC